MSTLSRPTPVDAVATSVVMLLLTNWMCKVQILLDFVGSPTGPRTLSGRIRSGSGSGIPTFKRIYSSQSGFLYTITLCNVRLPKQHDFIYSSFRSALRSEKIRTLQAYAGGISLFCRSSDIRPPDCPITVALLQRDYYDRTNRAVSLSYTQSSPIPRTIYSHMMTTVYRRSACSQYCPEEYRPQQVSTR